MSTNHEINGVEATRLPTHADMSFAELLYAENSPTLGYGDVQGGDGGFVDIFGSHGLEFKDAETEYLAMSPQDHEQIMSRLASPQDKFVDPALNGYASQGIAQHHGGLAGSYGQYHGDHNLQNTMVESIEDPFAADDPASGMLNPVRPSNFVDRLHGCDSYGTNSSPGLWPDGSRMTQPQHIMNNNNDLMSPSPINPHLKNLQLPFKGLMSGNSSNSPSMHGGPVRSYQGHGMLRLQPSPSGSMITPKYKILHSSVNGKRQPISCPAPIPSTQRKRQRQASPSPSLSNTSSDPCLARQAPTRRVSAFSPPPRQKRRALTSRSPTPEKSNNGKRRKVAGRELGTALARPSIPRGANARLPQVLVLPSMKVFPPATPSSSWPFEIFRYPDIGQFLKAVDYELLRGIFTTLYFHMCDVKFYKARKTSAPTTILNLIVSYNTMLLITEPVWIPMVYMTSILHESTNTHLYQFLYDVYHILSSLAAKFPNTESIDNFVEDIKDEVVRLFLNVLVHDIDNFWSPRPQGEKKWMDGWKGHFDEDAAGVQWDMLGFDMGVPMDEWKGGFVDMANKMFFKAGVEYRGCPDARKVMDGKYEVEEG